MNFFLPIKIKYLRYIILILTMCSVFNNAYSQDSIFIYKQGKILYRIPKYALDSITTRPIGYYDDYRNSHILEFIRSNPQTSTFAKMIEIAGYQNNLEHKTIWVPINDALKNISLTDTLMIKRIVRTSMIKNWLYYNYFSGTTTIKTLSGKKISFTHEGNTYLADGNEVKETDIQCMNSSINIVNGYNKGVDNIGEYLMSENVNPEMAAFVKKHVSMKDSVYMNDIGLPSSIFCEDSITTALIPDTQSWTDTYNFLYPYCVVPNDDSNHTKQKDYVNSIILQDCFFRGNIELPPSDSLKATSGNTITNTQSLFDIQKQITLSNGKAYTTNKAPFFTSDIINKDIILEAEDSSFGRSNEYSTITVKEINAKSFPISGGKYLQVEPSPITALLHPSVIFPVVGTFVGKYNIYCSILPTCVVDTANHRINKLRFYVTYQNVSGNNVTAVVNSSNNLITTPGALPATFMTTSDKPNKVFVAQIDLPYCNLNRLSPTLKVKVENYVKITEVVTYDPNFYIDSIILEKVE